MIKIKRGLQENSKLRRLRPGYPDEHHFIIKAIKSTVSFHPSISSRRGDQFESGRLAEGIVDPFANRATAEGDTLLAADEHVEEKKTLGADRVQLVQVEHDRQSLC